MNLYNLKVLYPTSNNGNYKQSFNIEIYANRVNSEHNCYKFFDTESDEDKSLLVAAYPMTYTIIKDVTYDV